MKLQDRFIALRGTMTQKAFAEAIDININTLRNYEKGLALPNSDVLSKICSVFNVSPSWLLLDKEKPDTDTYNGNRQDDFSYIPMVSARLSAGTGSLETEGTIEDTLAFRTDWLSRKGSVKDMVLMRVSGDSMRPTIEDGDVVLLDTSERAVLPLAGKIYAVGVEDMIYLKRPQTIPNKMLLLSDNAAYPPLEYDLRGDLADSIRIIGQVIWVCREL